MTTNLQAAVSNCRFMQARFLIDQGVSISRLKGLNMFISALQIPDENRRFRMFKWLIKSGCDSNSIDPKTGRNLLIWAAYLNCTNEVYYMLQGGLFPALHQDKYGRTALHYGTLHNNRDIVYIICYHASRYGLSVDIQDVECLTPFMIAQLLHLDDCKDILVKYGHALEQQQRFIRFDLDLNKLKNFSKRILARHFEIHAVKKQSAILPAITPEKKTRKIRPKPLDVSTTDENEKYVSYQKKQHTKHRILPIRFTTNNKTIKDVMPEYMTILSDQESFTYRPTAKHTPTRSSDAYKSIKLITAAKISSLAISIRKKKKKKSSKGQ